MPTNKGRALQARTSRRRRWRETRPCTSLPISGARRHLSLHRILYENLQTGRFFCTAIEKCWRETRPCTALPTSGTRTSRRERVLHPLNHRDDFSRPALRHGSLNSLFQVASYLPSCTCANAPISARLDTVFCTKTFKTDVFVLQ